MKKGEQNTTIETRPATLENVFSQMVGNTVALDVEHVELEQRKKATSEVSVKLDELLARKVELMKELAELEKKEITKATCKEAKALRMKFVKLRTATNEIHTPLKKYATQIGKYMDKWKAITHDEAKAEEEKLAVMENHFVKEEEERIQKVANERKALLEIYGASFIPPGLGEMAEEIWEGFRAGCESNYLERTKLAEQKAENDRLAAELKAKDEAEAKKEEEIERALQAQQNQAAPEPEEKPMASAPSPSPSTAPAPESPEPGASDLETIKALIQDLSKIKTRYSFSDPKNVKVYKNTGALLDKISKYIMENCAEMEILNQQKQA